MKFSKNVMILLIGFILFLNLARPPLITAETGSEDQYEPNDTFGTGIMLLAGYYPNLCQADDDWFKTSVQMNEIVEISIEFSSVFNDMRIELYNDAMNLVNSSDIGGDNEIVSWNTSVPMSLYFRITGDNNTELYDMEIYIYNVNGAFDDGFEENDNVNRAKYIPRNSTYYFLKNYDDDYFYHSVQKNEMINFYVFHNMGDSFDIAFYNESKVLMADLLDYDKYSTLREMDWVANYTGDLYIRILGDNTGKSYDFQLNITNTIDDAFEPNDWEGQATYFGNNVTFYGLYLNDIDYYQVNLSEYDELSVYISFNIGVSIDLNLYNAVDYSYLGGGMGGTTYREIYYGPATQNISINIQISAFEYNAERYDLFINITRHTANPMGDDLFEENDILSDAKSISRGSYYNNLVLADEDWYNITVYAHEILDTSVYYNNILLPSVYVELWLGGSMFRMNYSTEGTNFIRFENNASLVYLLIRVYTFEPTGNYSLYTSAMQDDAYEQNDHITQAYMIGTGYASSLQLYDQDYFKIQLSPYEVFNITVYCTVYANIRLYELSGTNTTKQLDSSTIDGRLNLLINGSSGQNVYYFLIDGTSSYSLETQSFLWDDIFEDNEPYTNAYTELNSGTFLNLIQKDWDYYRLNASLNASILVELRFNPGIELYLHLISSSGSSIKEDNSYSDGYLMLNFTAGSTKPVIGVSGQNIGAKYNLTISIQVKNENSGNEGSGTNTTNNSTTNEDTGPDFSFNIPGYPIEMIMIIGFVVIVVKKRSIKK